MNINENTNLANELTLAIVEKYNLQIGEIKNVISLVLKNYKVKYCENTGKNLSTSYLFKKFEEGKLAVGMNQETIQQYKIAINTLEKSTGKILGEIESEDLNNFFISYGKQVSSITVKNKYQLLSSIYNYLYTRKFIDINPILYVNPPKADVIFKKPLSELQLEVIKKNIESLPKKEYLRDMAIVYFFVSTGCRISELASLKIKDVDFQKKIAIVMGKGRKERPLILTDKALYRLNLYLNSRENKTPDSPLFATLKKTEGKLNKGSIGAIIYKLKTLSNNPKLTAHTFRRYYATELRKKGVPLQMISSSLGHSNLNTVQRYSLFNNSEMIETIEKAL